MALKQYFCFHKTNNRSNHTMLHFIKTITAALLGIMTISCQGKAASNTQHDMADNKGKILVAYYSYTGDCKDIADALTKAASADAVEIQPAEEGLDYAADNYAIGSRLIAAIRKAPAAAESYPAIKPVNADLEKYDTVIIVTPLWWDNMAAPMQTYLYQNAAKLAGKNIGLIVSSYSSGIAEVVKDAHRLIPDGNFTRKPLWINQSNRSRSQSLVTDWVKTRK